MRNVVTHLSFGSVQDVYLRVTVEALHTPCKGEVHFKVREAGA